MRKFKDETRTRHDRGGKRLRSGLALLAASLACLAAFALPAVANADPDTTPPPIPSEPEGPLFLAPGGTATYTFDDSIGGDVDHYVCEFIKSYNLPAQTTDEIDPCTSPQTFPNLTAANYAFKVRAVDAAGNQSEPAGIILFVANGAPPAGTGFAFNGPANGSAQSGSMTGFSGTMDTTTDGFPTYRHKYIPRYNVHIARVAPDGSLSGQASFSEFFSGLCFGCANIDWTDTTPPIISPYIVSKSGSLPSAEGQYRITANQSSASLARPGILEIRAFTIDSTAPDTTIDSSPVPGNDTTPNFTFSGTDPDPVNGRGSGIASFECRVDGGTWQSCVSGDPLPAAAGEGEHTFETRAVDGAGNKDATPASGTFIIDLTPPDITITKPENKDRYLLHDGPDPIFFCVDPLAGTPPVASGVATCTATPINDEDLGPHVFRVTATDNAGNTSTREVAYTIDPRNYGEFVGDDDPLAYYRLDEPVGSSDMLDRSGNNHHGIYQNGIALGRSGATACERRPHPPRACELAGPAENKAGYFPPRDGHGYVNGITAPKNAYTMEAWVKPKDGADMMVVSHGGGGQLFIKDGNLAFRQVQDTINSSGAVEPGKWSHVAATWDGHNTRLYVNGVQVAHSTTANKPPSGTSTFYVGYGEMAPWFHGDLDEVAYYDHALNQHAFEDRVKIGTARDNPSIEAGNSPLNTEGPFTDPVAPKNGGLYAPGKVPAANFSCSDPDDLPGDSDVAVCTATVDGNPIVSGGPLPDSVGDHSFVVTAIDEGGNEYIHPHTYTVKPFSSIYGHDNPIAYYRLGDGSGQAMVDASGKGKTGEYKNDQDSGPTGIAGDGDRARDFFGAGGYGYANGIAAPRYQSTLEAWVKPLGEQDPVSTGFDGTALPAGWSLRNIWNPGGSARVSGGQLIVDGASAGTNGNYGSGRTVDIKATFAPGTPFAHVGFGVDFNNPPWAMFSVKGDGRLYARSDNNAGDSLETDLGTGLLGSPHRFRIEWNASNLVYYVDGDVVATHAVSFGTTQMRPLVSEFNSGGGDLRVDWLRMSPYGHRDQAIVGHGDAGEIFIKGGQFKFRHMDKTVTSSVPVRPGEWQQVVGTWDGVDIRIYVDGIESGKTEATRRPSSISTFYVGYGELAPWFSGSIDEVAYYGTALPAARVYQHFLADPPPSDLGDAGGPGDSTVSGTGGGSTGEEPGEEPGEAPESGETPEPGEKPGSSEDPASGANPGPVDQTEPGSDESTSKPLAGSPKAASVYRVKVRRHGVNAKFSCGDRACAGKATGILILKKARFKLRSRSFAAPANGRGRLHFKFTRKQKRAAAAARSPRAKITLRARGGRVLDRG